jgi:hypothetical protein
MGGKRMKNLYSNYKCNNNWKLFFNLYSIFPFRTFGKKSCIFSHAIFHFPTSHFELFDRNHPFPSFPNFLFVVPGAIFATLLHGFSIFPTYTEEENYQRQNRNGKLGNRFSLDRG